MYTDYLNLFCVFALMTSYVRKPVSSRRQLHYCLDRLTAKNIRIAGDR